MKPHGRPLPARLRRSYLLSQTKVLQPKRRIQSLPDIIMHPQPVAVTDQDVSSEHFHTDLVYALTVHSDPAEATDEGESTDLRWLTKHELDNLMAADIFPSTRESYDFIFEKCLAE